MPTAPTDGVSVDYCHATGLTALLDRLGLALLLSTYQAGQVVSIGSHAGGLQLDFCRFDQPMGLARTSSGVAVGCRQSIWTLPANREIAARLAPEGEHDIAFLARTCHHSGPLLGHDLAWDGQRLWLVNTQFNGLVTIETPWSFVPRWLPPFISGWVPEDRCHLNGLALAEDGSRPLWVTALAESDRDQGWRDDRIGGGCLVHVPSGDVVLRGLAMPHSPRLYRGVLHLLDSGRGQLLRFDVASGRPQVVAQLPGFTRGLDCFAGHAFVGLSRIRESAVFGGLPLQQGGQRLECGLAVVDLASGELVAHLWFGSGVEEVFAVLALPGYRHPALVGPEGGGDAGQTVWMVPPPPA